MRLFLTCCFIGLLSIVSAQDHAENEFTREGFFFGAAAGVGALQLSNSNGLAHNEVSMSFPNFKFGWMLSPRFAVEMCLPGSLYTFNAEGRSRSRGFEGMVPSVQYWLKNRWWISGGVGIGLDAPAFYDIKTETERKFYFGSAALFSTGYEVIRTRKFAIDIQSRVHWGAMKIAEGNQNGTSFNFLIGINWY